jgi:hypothetical protein
MWCRIVSRISSATRLWTLLLKPGNIRSTSAAWRVLAALAISSLCTNDVIAVDIAAVSSMFAVACSSSFETARSAARVPCPALTLEMTRSPAVRAIGPSFFLVAAIDVMTLS